jgi:putative transposase
LSQRRAARLIPIERMTLRYTHHRDPQEALRVRLRELAGSRVRYGYRRLTVLLKREGWQVNAKRIYRLYLEEGLIVPQKVPLKLLILSGGQRRDRTADAGLFRAAGQFS